MSGQPERPPSVRRIVVAFVLVLLCTGGLLISALISDDLGGIFRWEDETVRLVAVEGELYAFDRGEHPEIDGFSYDDPEAAAETIAGWKRAHTRTNLWDRHSANPTHYDDPGHRWIESFDEVSLREEAAQIEGLGLTLPWIRVVSLEFEPGLRHPMNDLYGFNVAATGPSHPAVAYLREHAWSADMADRVAQGLQRYPRLELEPRFLIIPISQVVMLVLLSVWLTLGVSWCRRRVRMGGAAARRSLSDAGPAA